MDTPLKTLYNPYFFERFSAVLSDCIPGFEPKEFIFRIFNNAWPDMSLNERLNHIAKALHHFLSTDYTTAARQILSISNALRDEGFPHQGFENIFLAAFINTYRPAHRERSLPAKNGVTDAIT